MPELPEVENLKIGLSKFILNQRILDVKISKPKLVSGKGTKRISSNKKRTSFIEGVKDEKIIQIERRAKNLIFKLSHKKMIVAHLKMTGQFVYESLNKKNKALGGHPIEASEKTLPNKHTHIIFYLSSGNLYYNDTRMFGHVLFYKNQEEFQKETVSPTP